MSSSALMLLALLLKQSYASGLRVWLPHGLSSAFCGKVLRKKSMVIYLFFCGVRRQHLSRSECVQRVSGSCGHPEGDTSWLSPLRALPFLRRLLRAGTRRFLTAPPEPRQVKPTGRGLGF